MGFTSPGIFQVLMVQRLYFIFVVLLLKDKMQLSGKVCRMCTVASIMGKNTMWNSVYI